MQAKHKNEKKSIIPYIAFWGVMFGILLILVSLLINFRINQKDNEAEAESTIHNISIAPSLPEETENLLVEIIRVNSDGIAVIAGKSPKDAKVFLILDGSEIGGVVADNLGEWVYLAQEALPPGQHHLSLRAELPNNGDMVYSAGSLLLLAPDRLANTEKDNEQPIVLYLPRDINKGSRRLRQQFSAETTALGQNFTLDTIDYSIEGDLLLSGTVQSEDAELIIYLDNLAIARKKLTGKGAVPVNWQIRADKPFRYGQYNLRLDMVVDGKVVRRRVLPFYWQEPQDFDDKQEYLIVQPGTSLWLIAQRFLGQGARYTILYEANREQIEKPELIFPGQIIVIPPKKQQEAEQDKSENRAGQ